MMPDYTKEALASARAFARLYDVWDKADIATIAKQFEHDLRRNDELRELAA